MLGEQNEAEQNLGHDESLREGDQVRRRAAPPRAGGHERGDARSQARRDHEEALT